MQIVTNKTCQKARASSVEGEDKQFAVYNVTRLEITNLEFFFFLQEEGFVVLRARHQDRQ